MLKVKKWIVLSIATLFIIGSIVYGLNIKVTYQKGINYEVHTVQIPLYLKILNFVDRHYSYKDLVEKIVNGNDGDKERVIKIFEWTYQNIRKVPKDFPIVDDHVWNIIIRGYGVADQSSDVFTTLCNYAGTKAFFKDIFNSKKDSKYTFSFVEIEQQWSVFDPHNGICFINKNGNFASVQDIREGNWMIKSMRNNIEKTKKEYAVYFNEIVSIDFDESHKWSRANVQSPIKRFLYAIKKRIF